MAKEKDVKRSEAKRGGGGKTVAAVAIAALLLGGGGYYGLSGDGMGILPDHGFDPGSPAVSTEAPQPDTTAQEAPEKQDDVLSIRVSEDKVVYEGEEIAVTAFEEALLKDYREGVKISLKDDHAVKATYDQIKAVLDRLGYKYTEE